MRSHGSRPVIYGGPEGNSSPFNTVMEEEVEEDEFDEVRRLKLN